MHIRKFLGKKFTFYLKYTQNSQLVVGKESILGVYDKVYENSNVLGKNGYVSKKNARFACVCAFFVVLLQQIRIIMHTNTTHFVYQEPAIEFLTVAVQLCLYLEKVAEHEKADFIDKMLCLLPLLYIKARLLPKATAEMDGYPERFVTEQEYEELRLSIAQKLGSDDAYLEVFMEDMRYSDEPITAFISENIADIYQELKDLACNYQTREEAIMNDALVSCLDAFEQHWGQKLLNVLRPLHALSLDDSSLDNDI